MPKKTAKKKTLKAKTGAGKKVTAPMNYKTEVEDTFDTLVAQGKTYGTVLSPPNVYSDKRGDIINIINRPVGSAVLITSEANTVRANHYHKEDAHLCYVVSGSVHYYERPVGSTKKPEYTLIKAGQSFITGPNVEHAMKFTERTMFLTLGALSRTPSEYEKDLVRLVKPLAVPMVVTAEGVAALRSTPDTAATPPAPAPESAGAPDTNTNAQPPAVA